MPWLVLFFHLACLKAWTVHRAWSSWRILSHQGLLSQQSSRQNKRRKQPALWYISVFEFLWFIIQLPSNMFRLGSNFCWGLAAAMANRQLNIYILLRSSKQNSFKGSAVWAVKLLYLCSCLHNSNNIFMVNECKFYLNHDLAQGLSGDKMHTHKVQRDKSNNLFFQHKGLSKGWPCVTQAVTRGLQPVRAVKATWCSQILDRLSSHRAGIFLWSLTWRCVY